MPLRSWWQSLWARTRDDIVYPCSLSDVHFPSQVPCDGRGSTPLCAVKVTKVRARSWTVYAVRTRPTPTPAAPSPLTVTWVYPGHQRALSPKRVPDVNFKEITQFIRCSVNLYSSFYALVCGWTYITLTSLLSFIHMTLTSYFYCSVQTNLNCKL